MTDDTLERMLRNLFAERLVRRWPNDFTTARAALYLDALEDVPPIALIDALWHYAVVLNRPPSVVDIRRRAGLPAQPDAR